MAVPTSSRYFMGYRYGAHSEFDEIIAKDSYGAFAIQTTIRNMNPGEFLKDYRVWHLYEHGAANILTGLMKMHQTGRKIFPYVDLVRWALEEPRDKVFYPVMKTYLSLPINDKAPLWNLIKESELLKPVDHSGYHYRSDRIKPFNGLSAKASIRLLEFLHSVNPEEIKDFRGSWTDERDGQTYRTVTINGKTWLAENFKYRNKNGVYSLDDVLLGDFAPDGWHIPTPEEWYYLQRDVRISCYKNDSGEYTDFDTGKTLHENDYHAFFAKEAWEDAALNRDPGNVPLMEDDIGFGIKPTHRNKRCPGFNFALYWTNLGRSTAAAVVHNKFKDERTGSIPRFIFNRFDLAFGRDSADTFVEAHKNGALGLGCVRLVKD